MTREKAKAVNTIGMFDIFKGIGMVLVIFGHTFTGLFFDPSGNPLMKIPVLLLSPIGASLIPAFFLLSGYGFRKRPVVKCMKQQISLLLKPYLYVAAATVSLHLIFHYLAFHYWPASVKETLKVAGGFILALPQNVEFGSFRFFGCGAVWYIIALFLGWILLDILMNIVDEKYTGLAVLLVVLAGWIAGYGRNLPFCFSQGLIAVGFLHAGYRIKKNRLFLRELNGRSRLIILSACAISLFLTIWSGEIDNMDKGVWAAGPLSILIDTVVGVGIIMLILKLNRFDNPFLGLLQKIGRESLLIFCIHTVEMIAVPWYLLQERYQNHPNLCNLIIFCLRWGIIMAVIRGIRCRTLGKRSKE